jgi:hypothetical protein
VALPLAAAAAVGIVALAIGVAGRLAGGVSVTADAGFEPVPFGFAYRMRLLLDDPLIE